MKLRLILKDTVPPQGFRYTQAETGVRFDAPSLEELIEKVKKHRKANNLPIGLEFDAEVEDQLCQTMPAGICKRQDGSAASGFAPLTLESFKRGSMTLFSWWVGGSKTVDDDTIKSRIKICAGCHFNQKVADCASCSLGFLHDLVNNIFGKKRVEGMDLLDGCTICGCSNKVAVAIPLDVLHRNTPDELNGRIPDFCWKKR